MRIKVMATTALACILASPAIAQTQTSMPQATQGDGLDEIVVTAQKREQRLTDVPVAVTALTADMLSNRGITQVSDVTRAAPSLTVSEQNNPQSSSINLRGIGTSAFSTGVEPAVAVIVDDVALLQQAQAFSGLNDIARLEVLRGPQGTLFGKAASAGVINIVTQEPTQDVTAYLNAQATTDEEYRIDGMVSGAVNDWLAVRANAFYSEREGYIRNLTTGNKLGGADSVGARLRLAIKPTNNLSIDLTASYSRDQSTPVRTFRFVDPAAAIFGVGSFVPAARILPSLGGITPGPDNYRVRWNVEPDNDSQQAMYIGKINLDMGFANLISITSYQDWRFTNTEDTDSTDIAVVGGRPGGIYQNGENHARQFAQELRLVSNASGPFTYLGGLYYADGRTSRAFQRFAVGPGAARWNSEAGTQSLAAFAQATLDITPSTHIDGGLRWNREKISADFTNLVTTANPPANNATCLATCSGNATDEQVTYKVAVRQDITRDAMLYASYATGYKGQGYDISTGFTPARAANPVRPEHSKAYEIGFKGAFLNRKVQLNLAAFLTDYDDFQAQSAQTDPSGALIFQLNNVGKLRSKGIEGELSIRPFRALRIDAAATYLDAKIREFSGASCYAGQTAAQGCVDINPGPAVTLGQDLAGSSLSNSPKFKYNISATYDIKLPSMPFNAFIQGDWTHQSSVQFDLLGNPRTIQKAYGVANASIGIQKSDGAGYRISLFANNLFNQEYATSITQASGETAGLATVQFLPRNSRRYFGIRARFNY